MKILLISNLYPSKQFPHFGTFVKGFETAMEKQGVVFVAKVVIDKHYGNKLQLLLAYCIFFLKIILKGLTKKYDLVYVHYIAHPSLPILLLSYIKPCKIVLNIHGDDILPRTSLVNFFQKTIRLLLKRTSMVVVPSRYFKNVFLERFAYDADKVWIYPSGGVDRSLFQWREGVKLQEGFFGMDMVLGFVSRISAGKGWDIFIRAFEILNTGDQHYKAVIIGDGEQAGLLKKMLDIKKLNGKIRFIGKVPHDRLPYYFSKMDLFVFPSILMESLGLVGLEAMACGIPVIGSDQAGIKTYVTDSYNGFLFAPGDVDKLVSRIRLYSSLSPEERSEISRNCLQTASCYDSVKETERLYNKLKNI